VTLIDAIRSTWQVGPVEETMLALLRKQTRPGREFEDGFPECIDGNDRLRGTPSDYFRSRALQPRFNEIIDALAHALENMTAVGRTLGGEPIMATMMREVYIPDEEEPYGRFVKYFARESEISIYLPYTEFGGENNLPKEITVTVESKG
jgi:hypothetical protein